MQALGITQRPAPGDLRTMLRMMELPAPEPGRGQVRIDVRATAINIDDVHMAEGTMMGGFPVAPTPTPARPWVPGTEFVGRVEQLGAGVTELAVGQLVYGMRPPKLAGPWATQCVTKASMVSPAPEGWGIAQLAGLCLGGAVTHSMISALESVQGRRCLVIGASGGLGTLLVQMLVELGAHVWGVCSGKNRALVLGLGAERVFDYHEGSFGDQLADEGSKVDVCFDFIGGRATWRAAQRVTQREGHFVTVVGPEQYVGERKLGALGLTGMLGSIAGAWVGSRFRGPRYHFVGPLAPDFAAIERLVIRPDIRPLIDREVAFDALAVREAIAHVCSHRARGKVVLRVESPS